MAPASALKCLARIAIIKIKNANQYKSFSILLLNKCHLYYI